jgi:uncharacterized protein (TIGR03083 family)
MWKVLPGSELRRRLAGMMTVEPDRQAVRQALDTESHRVAGRVRGSARLDGPVPGLDWTVGQVAAHLSVIYHAFAAAVRGEDFGADLSGVSGGGQTLPQVTAAVNAFALELFPLGSPGEAADALESGAAELLAAVAEQPDLQVDRVTPWYGPGMTRTVGGLAALAVSETLVHGRDLALALGGDRRLAPEAAAAVAATVLSEMMPGLLDQRRAGRVSGRFELRIRGGQRFVLHIEHGKGWTTAAPGSGVDCVMWLSGSTALLVGLGRMPLWRAVAGGGALAFGRKPWLGLRLPSLFLTP